MKKKDIKKKAIKKIPAKHTASRKNIAASRGRIVPGTKRRSERGSKSDSSGKSSDFEFEKKNLKGEKVTGIIKVNQKGFAFVIPDKDNNPYDKQEDVFIPADSVSDALTGDRVVATIKKSRRYFGGQSDRFSRGREGYVSKILERADHKMTGCVYEKRKKGFFVTADGMRTCGEIRLIGDISDVKADDIVVYELVRLPKVEEYHGESAYGVGELVEIIGKQNAKGADITAIVRKCGIRSEFPDDVIKELNDIPDEISQEEMEKELQNGRTDLRNIRIVTIDSKDTKDVDDGVSVKKMKNGHYLLGVHIADVTHYVTEGSPLDMEARERGNSVYLPDRVIPMLPKKLSNGICSLNVGVPRFALSVMMEIDEYGNVVSEKVQKSLINVEYKITYEQLYAIMENHDEVLGEEFKKYLDDFDLMREAAGVLKRKREADGSVDFYFPETKVILDDDGKCVDIKEYHITFANNIIEEFMLCANKTIAKKYCDMDIPFMYRVHERPTAEKEGELLAALGVIGVTAGHDSKGRMRPKDYRELLLKVKGDRFEEVVNTLALRSMQKACYSNANKGHFGLAFDYYTHFTSPIRRYSDLFIHRMIKKTIDAGSPEKAFLGLETKYLREAEEQAETCSKTERMADEAEREAVDLKISEYMTQFLGHEFIGKVSGVTNFGVFVRLENSAEGLIRYESFRHENYRFVEKRMMAVGERSGKKIMLGTPIKVIVASCDPTLRKVDFVPVEE